MSLGINQDFLQEHPSIWDTNDEYVRAQIIVRQWKVVNDAAERGVALCQSFNGVLTNQEEQSSSSFPLLRSTDKIILTRTNQHLVRRF